LVEVHSNPNEHEKRKPLYFSEWIKHSLFNGITFFCDPKDMVKRWCYSIENADDYEKGEISYGRFV
jgi:hypothetical protein